MLDLTLEAYFIRGVGEDEKRRTMLGILSRGQPSVANSDAYLLKSVRTLVDFICAQLLREPLTSDSVSKTRPVTPDIRGPETDFYDDRHSLQFKPIDSISSITVYLEFLKSREANSSG